MIIYSKKILLILSCLMVCPAMASDIEEIDINSFSSKLEKIAEGDQHTISEVTYRNNVLENEKLKKENVELKKKLNYVILLYNELLDKNILSENIRCFLNNENAFLKKKISDLKTKYPNLEIKKDDFEMKNCEKNVPLSSTIEQNKKRKIEEKENIPSLDMHTNFINKKKKFEEEENLSSSKWHVYNFR